MPVGRGKMTLEVVLGDAEALSPVMGPGVRVIRHAQTARAARLRNVFVLSSATALPEIAGFVTAVNRLHRLRALFVRQDADPAFLPQLLERANLRAVRNMIVHVDDALPRRVLTAWRHGAQDRLIANATVAGDRLLLLTCALDTVEVPFAAVPALRRLPAWARPGFIVLEEGSHVHWPAPDIHLDLDAVRSVLDPTWNAHASARVLAAWARYGEGVAQVRAGAGLRQADIQGLSERQVRRLEAGGVVTAAALRSLAAAHGMAVGDYLSAVATAVRELGSPA